jgi:serine/threonine-protein kinase
MGEVLLCLDHRIGRHIAMKRRHSGASGSSGSDRFFREICVQGQLEHPSVVPLYDLATSAEGDAYFTMKHVRGRTLKSIVAAIGSGDTKAAEEYPLRRLLGAFASVCLAAAYAHSRGVVHRDLKPDNIMIGDFGEVYVLDWGVAKIASESTRPSDEGVRVPARDEDTSEGSAIGTIGYMAPEQLRGELDTVDERADVYSLGAILFEILAGKALHEGGREERMASTVAGADARVHLRVPDRDAPPELEAICVAATQRDPRDRNPTARAVHDAVEAYLSHDRNLELRRSIAIEHARVATAAVERALGTGKPAIEDRRLGVLEAGRALALDPMNDEARGAMMRLLTEPPREMPEEVRRELEASTARRRAAGDRLASWSIASGLLYLPVLLWMGIRSYVALAAFVGLILGTIAIGRIPSHKRSLLVMMGAIFATICASSSVAGPFIGIPCLAGIGVAIYNSYSDRFRPTVCAMACASFGVPALAQWFGLLRPMHSFDGQTIVTLPWMVSFPPGPSFLLLMMTSIGFIIMAATVTGRMYDNLSSAERQLAVQAWQLRQLVPRPARSSGPSPGAS